MGRHGRGPHWHGGPPWADFPDVVAQRFFDRAWSGGGRRMRRGDVKGEVLSALLDGPAHGYEVIRRLEEKSGGMWRPSPGSVYPTLQMLEDAGLVRGSEQDGRRTYELTDEGRAEAERSGESGRSGEPGEPGEWGPSGRSARSKGGGGDWHDHEAGGRIAARNAMVQLHMAARQVAMSGTPDQVDRAAAVLRQARQSLYQILAED